MHNLFPSREGLGVGVVGSILKQFVVLKGRYLVELNWLNVIFRIIDHTYYPPLNPHQGGEDYVFDCECNLIRKDFNMHNLFPSREGLGVGWLYCLIKLYL